MAPEGSLRVYKSPPLFLVMIQIDPVNSTPSYFPKIHVNIIHSITTVNLIIVPSLLRLPHRTQFSIPRLAAISQQPPSLLSQADLQLIPYQLTNLSGRPNCLGMNHIENAFLSMFVIQPLQLPSNGSYNTVSNSNTTIVEACLPRCCIATGVVSLSVSRCMPGNCLYAQISFGQHNPVLVTTARTQYFCPQLQSRQKFVLECGYHEFLLSKY
jgi:hypothetical protein